jgi:hypothetical protein
MLLLINKPDKHVKAVTGKQYSPQETKRHCNIRHKTREKQKVCLNFKGAAK